MVKVTIEHGEEVNILTGEGILFAIPNGDDISAGIVGSFTSFTRYGSLLAITEMFKDIDESEVN